MRVFAVQTLEGQHMVAVNYPSEVFELLGPIKSLHEIDRDDWEMIVWPTWLSTSESLEEKMAGVETPQIL